MRTPDTYAGLVIPGGQVTVLDVTAVVTLRYELATTVSVREGRLIVDQLQSADGSNGTNKGLAVTPAAPRGAPTWWFADGPATEGAHTVLAVQNPTPSAGEGLGGAAPRRQRHGLALRGHGGRRRVRPDRHHR